MVESRHPSPYHSIQTNYSPLTHPETTIRVLGGLLSCYSLTGDGMFLQKASDLGERLLPAFQTRSGIPHSDVNLVTHTAHGPSWAGNQASLAEATTLQLCVVFSSMPVGICRTSSMPRQPGYCAQCVVDVLWYCRRGVIALPVVLNV